MRTIERTRRYPREQPIDCERWVSFVFVTASMRDITLRVVELDESPEMGLELKSQAGERPAPKI